MNLNDLIELASAIAETDAERMDDVSLDLGNAITGQLDEELQGKDAITFLALQPRDRRTIFAIVQGHIPTGMPASVTFLAGLDFGIIIALALQKLGRMPFSLGEK